MNEIKTIGTIYEDKDGKIEENLQFYDCCICDGKMYFSAQERNGLFEYDLSSKTTKKILSFENEDSLKINIHRRVFLYNHKLIFIPHYGRHIHIVNMDDWSQRALCVIDNDDGVVNYSNAFDLGDQILLIPSFKKCELLRFKKEEEIITPEKYFWEQVQAISKEDNVFFDIFSSACIDNKLILSVFNSEKIIILNGREAKQIDLPSCVKGRSISVSNNVVWLTDCRSTCVYSFDISNENFKTYDLPDNGISFPFVTIAEINGMIVALAGYGNESYMLDKEFDEFKEIFLDIPVECERISKDYALFTGWISISDGCVFLLPRGINRMLCLDYKLRIVEVRNICDDSDEIRKYLRGNPVREEGIKDDLRVFISDLV